MSRRWRSLWQKLVGSNRSSAAHQPVLPKGRSARRRMLFEALEDRRVMAVDFIDPNPSPGNQFGHSVVPLTNGNVVITAPFDDYNAVDSGAVYLFNGTTGALISTLRGSHDLDNVGNVGVVALANGNFVVSSSNWRIGSSTGPTVGAVTWGSGTTGVSGVVSSSNSLIGSTPNDGLGGPGSIVALPNGNYVSIASGWDNGLVPDTGAVTWANGSVGISGAVSAANSLVGSASDDRIGQDGITILSNSNYVIGSSQWGGLRGAVTWANGSSGLVGAVSSSNSLVGSTTEDMLGVGGITRLTNGHYVVSSPYWNNGVTVDAGAVTWANGSTGSSGVVSAINSLVGSAANDTVGMGGVTPLTNGNYVVNSFQWDRSGIVDAGAVTWANGSMGIAGTITSSNSLVGERANDRIGLSRVTALTNGNYVVSSSEWDNNAVSNAGAVTWANGTVGITGFPTISNSLVGTSANHFVGDGSATALTNGNYVVSSRLWDQGGPIDIGAATWGNGATGTVGNVSAVNSLIGSSSNDVVGAYITPLTNGNYLVGSPLWDNGSLVNTGAVTWRSGTAVSSGVVSAVNSLVGDHTSDGLGDLSNVRALSNGNYIVATPQWDNGTLANAGAITWGSGTVGVTGTISAATSLVGTAAGDGIGGSGVLELPGGNLLIPNSSWDNGGLVDIGAITIASASSAIVGTISASNSLIGSTAGDGFGSEPITILPNGNYVIGNSQFDSPTVPNAGSATWGEGSVGIVGTVATNAQQSAVGTASNLTLQPVVVNAATGDFIVRYIGAGTSVIRVGSQVSGFTAPIPATLTAMLQSGDLTITDSDSAGKANSLTVSLVNVSGMNYIEFSDAAEPFVSAPTTTPASFLSNLNRRLRIPLSATTGSITLDLGGGADVVTLNLASGDVIPTGGLRFHGGLPVTNSGDQLILSGGSQGSVAYNYGPASDGNVVLGNFGTVTYTGLEAIVNSGTATNVSLNLPAVNNTITVEDDGTNGNGLSRVSGSTIVTTDFTNPTGAFSLNRGSAADSIAFAALPDLTANLQLGTTLLPFGSLNFNGAITLAANKSISAFAAGQIALPIATSDLAVSGTGQISLDAQQKISLATGSSLRSESGAISLSAAQPTTTTSGNFHTIDVSGGAIVSTLGNVQLTADSMNLASAAEVTATAGTVTLQPKTAGFGIDLGAADSLTTLGLTDAELDLVTAGTLVLGSSTSGALTISGSINRVAATTLNLNSGAAISFTTGTLNSAGGNVVLNPATSISFATSGVDVVTGAGTLSFGSGDDLTLAINGLTPDIQHQQLNVAGQLNLMGLDLILTGSAPSLNDSFIIVNNDGSEPIVGRFTGLPEGAILAVNGVLKRITYIGGDGNDVALLANTLPTISPLSTVNVLEDVTLTSIPLAGLSAGSESQAFAISAVSDNPALIPIVNVVHSGTNATGSLTFTPVANANGSAAVTVSVRDAGFDGVLHNADDGTTITSFVINVTAVNDAPTFTKGGNLQVAFGSAAQTIHSWAKNISPGPSDEAGQTVTFQIVGNTAPELFLTAPAVANNGTLTYAPLGGVSGSATISVIAFDGTTSSAVQTFIITIDPPPPTFIVSSFVATSTGAVIDFLRPFDPAPLNLYATQPGGSGPSDVTLVGATTGVVTGSLVMEANLQRITFVATNGRLPADTYTLTLRSANDGFRDAEGFLLDGDANGADGADFVRSFEITASPANAVTIQAPNFVRGPLQYVNLPAAATSGLPISFSDGGGITSANFEIRYNPALLHISSATVANGLPVGAAVSINTTTPGVAVIQFTSPTPLASGTTRFIDLQAQVPATAPYLQKQVLDVTTISLNAGGIPGLDDDGLHVAAYFGDLTGNGTLSAQDATDIARIAVGFDNGFAVFPTLDPRIVGDITGNGTISSFDVTRMLQVAAALTVAEVPEVPPGVVSLVMGGPDPKLSIPSNLAATAGDELIIPVNIDSIVDLSGNGLESADLAIYYDPTVLDVTSVTVGELLGSSWLIAARIDPLAGRIFISTAGSQPLEGQFIGEFLKLHARVKSTAPSGGTAINLAAASHDPARSTQLNEGFLTLIPAPTNAANDPGVDGLLMVTAGPDSPPGVVATATSAAGRLEVFGTAGNDYIYVSPISSTQVRVRVSGRILGDFPTPSELHVDGLTGDDYIFVAPSLQSILIPAPASSSPSAIDPPSVGSSSAGEFVPQIDSPPTETTTSAVAADSVASTIQSDLYDAALLQLFWSTERESSLDSYPLPLNRRRR
ncbi:cohesin domain-containing protein [Anatilimnocola sp. NA78]|uniref:cohesin domain-containing protein n=1 Tax=Anatilimnocola sp. NA78 TaxID=3415683 RepID=UPI003CE4B720